MIDWITARVPVQLPRPIWGGEFVSLRPDGSVEFAVKKRVSVPGSYASSIQVRAIRTDQLEIDGNPAKMLRGHNLWGSGDLPTLLAAMVRKAMVATLGEEFPFSIPCATISRVDCTEMLELPHAADVRAWLKAAAAHGTVRYRGRGTFKDGVLRFGDFSGKAADSWQLKLYHKGEEVRHRRDFRDLDAPLRDEAIGWADRCLRAEVMLKRKELEKQGLRYGIGWYGADMDKSTAAARIWAEKVKLMELSDVRMVEAERLEGLPPGVIGAYTAWRSGVDLRQMFPKQSTFYRYRKRIRDTLGVDIQSAPPTSNVVPMVRVLEASPARRPEWAGEFERALTAA
ncbi:MAG: phage/plasmid replication protein, II/X family [Brevundimonas sp.]|uniref:phage/plasmid replication protein, II/X family n=1 Tax=Brevundimonas sp. TaxID=1871086 RepID=UPI003918A86C